MKNIAVIVESRPEVDTQRIIDEHLRYLPEWEVSHESPAIHNGHDYNRLLTGKDFWQRYAEYHRVLLFQHDSAILRYGIEEFLEYDYVGAPWRPDAPWGRADRRGGNGGFSIRNPRMMLAVLNKFNYNESQHGNEDVFFVHRLDRVGGNIAPLEVCSRFACETIFKLGTFGYHAVYNHVSELEFKQITQQYDHVLG